jgi:hypothetical protein
MPEIPKSVENTPSSVGRWRLRLRTQFSRITFSILLSGTHLRQALGPHPSLDGAPAGAPY